MGESEIIQMSHQYTQNGCYTSLNYLLELAMADKAYAEEQLVEARKDISWLEDDIKEKEKMMTAQIKYYQTRLHGDHVLFNSIIEKWRRFVFDANISEEWMPGFTNLYESLEAERRAISADNNGKHEAIKRNTLAKPLKNI